MSRRPILILFFPSLFKKTLAIPRHTILNRDVKKAKEFMAGGRFAFALIAVLIFCILSVANAGDTFTIDDIRDPLLKAKFKDMKFETGKSYRTWFAMDKHQKLDWAIEYRSAVSITLMVIDEFTHRLSDKVSADVEWPSRLITHIDRHYADPENRKGIRNILYWVTKQFIAQDIVNKAKELAEEDFGKQNQ